MAIDVGSDASGTAEGAETSQQLTKALGTDLFSVSSRLSEPE